MNSFHGKDWTQKIHMTTWFCDLDHTPVLEFRDEESFRRHLVAKHIGISKWKAKSLLRRNRAVGCREQIICPLCECSPPDIPNKMNFDDKLATLFSHIGLHLLSLALLSLPTLDLAGPKSDEDDRSIKAIKSGHDPRSNSDIKRTDDSSHTHYSESESPKSDKILDALFDEDLDIRSTDHLELPDTPIQVAPLLEGEEVEWKPHHFKSVSEGPDSILNDIRASQLQQQTEESGSVSEGPDSILNEIRASQLQQQTEESGSVLTGVHQLEQGDLLEELENAKIEWPKGSSKYFIPRDSLETIVNMRSVEAELTKLFPSLTSRELHQYVDIIFDPLRMARGVFVTVLRTRKESILDILEEGVTDLDLPLERQQLPTYPGNYNRRFVLFCSRDHYDYRNCTDRDHATCKITSVRSMSNWTRNQIENFDAIQWRVKAPVFEKLPQGEIQHFDLHSNVVMPYVEDGEEQLEQSGYSYVWPVRIHPAHQSVYKRDGRMVRLT